MSTNMNGGGRDASMSQKKTSRHVFFKRGSLSLLSLGLFISLAPLFAPFPPCVLDVMAFTNLFQPARENHWEEETRIRDLGKAAAEYSLG